MAHKEAEEVDKWIADMEEPFRVPKQGRKRRPTQRELELEAEGFAALYAQVKSS